MDKIAYKFDLKF